jgi:hypothetical protein
MESTCPYSAGGPTGRQTRGDGITLGSSRERRKYGSPRARLTCGFGPHELIVHE